MKRGVTVLSPGQVNWSAGTRRHFSHRDMRIWLHATAKRSSITGSTAFSFAAHAVLVGAAIYGTGLRARQLDQSIAERIALLHYLPPPDRRPTSDNIAEHLQYINLGSTGQALPVRADGQVFERAGVTRSSGMPGQPHDEAQSQAPAAAFDSRDSVYSMLEVEETAVRTAGSAAPAYPPELMMEGKEGGVYLRFVVDTAGRAEAASIEVLRSSHPAFTQSVQQALPLMLYTPATIAGRRVRQLVEQNFEFRITRPALAEHTRTQPVP